MTDDKLNGSVNVLAKAMRQVFAELVEPLATKDDLKRIETDMQSGFEAVNEDIRRLETDMKAGFDLAAEDRRRIEGDMQNGFAEIRIPNGGGEESLEPRPGGH